MFISVEDPEISSEHDQKPDITKVSVIYNFAILERIPCFLSSRLLSLDFFCLII